jgi:hypothetical protein
VSVRVVGTRLPPLEGDVSWVYFGNEAAPYYRARADLRDRAAEIPAGPLVNELADEFRHELLNVDELLVIRNEVLWQTSDLAEGNPFTHGLQFKLCCVLALRRLLEQDDSDLLILVDNPGLGRRLAQVARAYGRDGRSRSERLAGAAQAARERFGLVARAGVHRLLFLDRHRKSRALVRRYLKPPTPGAEVDLLLVTWARAATFDAEAVIDSEVYFGRLPEAARRNGYEIGWLANPLFWVQPLEAILESVGAARDAVIVSEQALRRRDLVSIVLRTLRSPARPKRRCEVGGIDVRRLVADEVRRERAKPRQLWAMQFFYVGRFLASHARPGRLFFLYENQPWEKGLRLGLRAALPAVEIVACQHATLAARWFSFFPSNRDIAGGQIPDRLVVIGPFWRRVFASEGFPAERILVAPALRFPELGRAANDGGNASRTILVAGSIGSSDSLELVAKTVVALEEVEELDILIKLHPVMAQQEESFRRMVLSALERETWPARFTFATGTVEDVLRRSSIVLYNSTSVSYEALAVGLPAVFVESDFWFDLDPLPAESGLRITARTPEEIQNVVLRLLDEPAADAEARRSRAQEFIADAFAPGDAEVYVRQVVGPPLR